MVENEKIYGFYFAALINNWRPIVEEQLTKLFESKLFKLTNKLFIRVYYVNDFDLDIFKKLVRDKPNIILSCTDENEYEFGILSILKEESKKSDFKCYYFHAKGVSKLNNSKISQRIASWRKYMEYFLIDRFEDCINELDSGFDAVGVNLKTNPKTLHGFNYLVFANILQSLLELNKIQGFYQHFSGNFWWANSSFIKTLPDLKYLLNHRHHAEFWIGYTKGNLKSLYHTEQAGYKSIVKVNYKS